MHMHDQDRQPSGLHDRLLVLGHLVAYIGVMLSAGLQNEQLRYVLYAGAALQMLAVVPAFGAGSFSRFRHAGVLFVTTAYVVVLAVVGALRGNWFSFFAFDALCL